MTGEVGMASALILELLGVLELVLLRRHFELALAVRVLLGIGRALGLEVNVSLLRMAGADIVGAVGGSVLVGGDAAEGVVLETEGVLQGQLLVRLGYGIRICKLPYSLQR